MRKQPNPDPTFKRPKPPPAPPAVCEQCNGDNYILTGCCSGNDCGCRGLPVQMTDCEHCNPESNKPPKGEAAKYADFVEYV